MGGEEGKATHLPDFCKTNCYASYGIDTMNRENMFCWSFVIQTSSTKEVITCIIIIILSSLFKLTSPPIAHPARMFAPLHGILTVCGAEWHSPLQSSASGGGEIGH